MAATYERLVKSMLSGDTSAIRAFEFRFTRPLVLPASPSLFIDREQERFWVGDSKGSRPYMRGAYSLASRGDRAS